MPRGRPDPSPERLRKGFESGDNVLVSCAAAADRGGIITRVGSRRSHARVPFNLYSARRHENSSNWEKDDKGHSYHYRSPEGLVRPKTGSGEPADGRGICRTA